MNNTHDTQKNKIEEVLEKIRCNSLKPKSKMYFRLKFVALIILTIMAVISSIFLASLIAFSIRVAGHSALLNMGLNGWEVFILMFPWYLFGITILLIAIIERIIRTFRIGYKIPVAYLFLSLVFLMLITAIAFDMKIRMHDNLSKMSRQSSNLMISPFKPLYDEVRRPKKMPVEKGMFRGIVFSKGTSTLTVMVDSFPSTASMPIIVRFSTSTDMKDVDVDDRIFMSGRIHEGEIEMFNFSEAW